MTLKLLGRIDQGLEVEESFHRNYKIKWLIETDDTRDGPTRVMNCPGVPSIGSAWSFGNDNDQIAYCWPNWTVSQFNSSNQEPNTLWVLEQPYSTRFNLIGMNQDNVENPFAAPPELSGTFVKYQKEQRYDQDGKVIQTMSFEPIRGEMSTFDSNHPTVSCGMNYPQLGINVFAFMIDNVNDSPMWGLPSRCVKLSNIRWTRNVYKFGYFYTRSYDFDINYKTFDRIVPEMGYKKLKEGGNKRNSKHWSYRRDADLNVVREPFYYDKDGKDWDADIDPDGNTIAKHYIRYYRQTNLFVLGIPSSF